MAEHSLRFGVTNGNGLRSVTWKCWTISGAGKKDVYLLCRAIGNAIKLSMHESGRWHVGFASPNMFDDATRPASRYLGVWEKPSPVAGSYILACRVHVPANAVSIQDDNLETDVYWAASAPEGQATEFVIFLTDRPYYGYSLVELLKPSPKFIGSLPLEGGGAIHLVSHLRKKVDLGPPYTGKVGQFKRTSREDVLNGNRAVLWNVISDGSIMFLDTPVTVSPT
jgi:hypothetical protein